MFGTALDDARRDPSTAPVDYSLSPDEVEGFFTEARREALEKLKTRPDTLVRMRGYLAALGERGLVTHAAKCAGVSAGIVQDWRVKYEVFAEMEAEARRHAADRLEAAAIRRARDGVLKPIWQKGMFCGYERVYSDTLMVELLRAADPERFARKTRTELSGPGGGPIEIAPVVNVLRDRIRKLKRAAETPEPEFDAGEAVAVDPDDTAEVLKKFTEE